MNESPESETGLTLREVVLEMRGDMREANDRNERAHAGIIMNIEGVNAKIDSKFDVLNKRLDDFIMKQVDKRWDVDKTLMRVIGVVVAGAALVYVKDVLSL